MTSVPPPGLSKSFIAVELSPVVWIEPVAVFVIETAAALLNMPSDWMPKVVIVPLFRRTLWPAPVPCAESASNRSLP